MRRDTPYDIHAQWDDPFDRPTERRQSSRFKSKLKLRISVKRRELRGRMVGPGIVENLSLSGASILTKHDLEVGQEMALTIPTDYAPEDLCLPRAFMGPARVQWLVAAGDNTYRAGIVFGDRISQDMEFAVFIDYLKSISTLMRAS